MNFTWKIILLLGHEVSYTQTTEEVGLYSMASLVMPFQFLPAFRYFTTKIAGEGCFCYLGGREFNTKSEAGKHFN